MLCTVFKTLWTSKNKSCPTPRAARHVFWDFVHLLNQPRAPRKINYGTFLLCSKHNRRKVSLDFKRSLFLSRRANVLDHKRKILRVLKQLRIPNLISLDVQVGQIFITTYQIIYGRKLLWRHSRSELDLDQLKPRRHLSIHTSVRMMLRLLEPSAKEQQ